MAGNEHDSQDHAHEELHEQPAAPQAAGSAVPRPEEAANKALSDALKVTFLFLKWAMVVLVLVYLLTGIFTVQPEEVKFKLRFGQLVRDANGQMVLRPGGWHLRWPWEEVVTVPTVEKTLTLEKEFWAAAEKGPDILYAQALNVRSHGYLLTGDANVVHMKLRVHYRPGGDNADSAVAYAFLVKDPEETLRRVFTASVVKVVGSMPVMDVINRKGLMIERISQELERRLADFEKTSGAPLGIKLGRVEAVEQENIKNPTEPGAVRQAFADAQNAASRRNALVSEGQSQAETIRNGAEAQRAEMLADATGYATRLVRSAKADAAQMQQLSTVFEHSQGEANLLMEDFYQRTLVEVLDQAPGPFVFHEQPEGASQQLRLQFTKAPLPQKQGGAAGNQPAGAPGAPGGQAGPTGP